MHESIVVQNPTAVISCSICASDLQCWTVKYICKIIAKSCQSDKAGKLVIHAGTESTADDNSQFSGRSLIRKETEGQRGRLHLPRPSCLPSQILSPTSMALDCLCCDYESLLMNKAKARSIAVPSFVCVQQMWPILVLPLHDNFGQQIHLGTGYISLQDLWVSDTAIVDTE
jgi:hypothetical protein